MGKVILAYSGGLDTSVCISWLKEKRNFDVMTYSADLGQGDELEPLAERALAAGAVSAHVGDLKERFLTEYVWPLVRAGAMYSNGYLLATAIGRPLIAFELVRIGRENGATAVAHGCTGKGNDQVRIETTIAALAPEMRIVAPLREWEMKTREEEIEYAERRGIPIPVKKGSLYSYDRNLWGMAIEAGSLEDPWAAPPEDAFVMTANPLEAPDEPEFVELEFADGVPVALNGSALGPVELVAALNEIAGRHGVGRLDTVEDRLVGIKSREVYEAPAATVIFAAREAIEQLTLGRDLMHFKRPLSLKYGELVYYGLWFTDLREALDAFFLRMARHVVGTVRLRLYKGGCAVVGRKSPQSLYKEKLATYSVGDAFDHSAADGFLTIWGLPVRAEAERRERIEKPGR